MELLKTMQNVLDKVEGRPPRRGKRSKFSRFGPDGRPQSVMGLLSSLGVKVHRRDGSVEDLGVVGRRCVTTAFTNYLVNAFVSTSTALTSFEYHSPGSGTTTEATSDTSLYTAIGNRGTGTNTAAVNVFTSVCTITFTAANSITEHGVFSATTGGTLLDRTSFAAVSVASGDSIGFTYQLTATAGG